MTSDASRPQPGQTIAAGRGHRRESGGAVLPGGGKSELQRAVRRVTPGQGNLTDSGTENTQLTWRIFGCAASNGEKVR
jgi:hypothetical protein